MIPDAHLLNQALEDQTNTVSLVLTFFNRGGLLSKTDKVQYREFAQGKRREIHDKIPYNEYRARTKYFFHEWISGKKSISVIGLYYPVNSEMNPLSLIDYLDTRGKITCLPIVIDENSPLIFKTWAPGKDVVAGRYGIPVPDNDKIVIPDLVICPLLAYDAKGMRLGYGGGFYDRTIRHLRRNKQTRYMGLAFSEQKSYHDLPSEEHDVPLEAVLTETGIINF